MSLLGEDDKTLQSIMREYVMLAYSEIKNERESTEKMPYMIFDSRPRSMYVYGINESITTDLIRFEDTDVLSSLVVHFYTIGAKKTACDLFAEAGKIMPNYKWLKNIIVRFVERSSDDGFYLKAFYEFCETLRTRYPNIQIQTVADLLYSRDVITEICTSVRTKDTMLKFCHLLISHGTAERTGYQLWLRASIDKFIADNVILFSTVASLYISYFSDRGSFSVIRDIGRHIANGVRRGTTIGCLRVYLVEFLRMIKVYNLTQEMRYGDFMALLHDIKGNARHMFPTFFEAYTSILPHKIQKSIGPDIFIEVGGTILYSEMVDFMLVMGVSSCDMSVVKYALDEGASGLSLRDSIAVEWFDDHLRDCPSIGEFLYFSGFFNMFTYAEISRTEGTTYAILLNMVDEYFKLFVSLCLFDMIEDGHMGFNDFNIFHEIFGRGITGELSYELLVTALNRNLHLNNGKITKFSRSMLCNIKTFSQRVEPIFL